MASPVLQLLALLVLVVFAANGHHAPDHHGDNRGSQHDHNLDHLLSENDGDLKELRIDDNERTITIPPISFNPTPVTATLPTQRPTGRPVVIATGPVITVSRPPIVTLPNPQAPSTESPNFDLVCGKKGRCYQWFDDDWQLDLDGYTRCNAGDLRRARRYCCIP